MDANANPTDPNSQSAQEPLEHELGKPIWYYIGGLAPGLIVWLVMVAWLTVLIYDRGAWFDEADAATLREWLDEARNFRKTLPDLVQEYVELLPSEDQVGPPAIERLKQKREEIEEHMRGLAEPTRMYLGQLPTFPVIYQIEVEIAAPTPEGVPERIVWSSPLPRPRQADQHRVRELVYTPTNVGNDAAKIRCEYQLHAFNRLERREEDRQRSAWVAGVVLLAATLLASLFVYRFLRRERQREIQRLTVLAQAEHQEREVLEIRLRQQEAERERDELDRRLLEQELEKAKLQQRANTAEKTALEMKSQLYASIGIMAGSYAHNIKNLLVRPNDLLTRCIEADGMSLKQADMLHEVKSTLGTVTERLQEILRTVRRDPENAEFARVDLCQMVDNIVQTWEEMGRDKWKIRITADLPGRAIWVNGDFSHIQQAIENLLFNARDALFEMRNYLREQARQLTEPNERKQRLLEAAGWVGTATLTVRDVDGAQLEVRDAGIGMRPDVLANCLKTHFTTKRNNALFEGLSAGMGLGLSFVAMVLEHHQAKLEIESEHLQGTVFRICFPKADEQLPISRSSMEVPAYRRETGSRSGDKTAQ